MAYLQFPLLILFILLLGAVMTPLLMKRFNLKGKYFILTVLIASLSLSAYLLFQVMTQGSYMYNIGNWSPTIGIQFSVDEFSTMMVFFILMMTTLVVIYSLRDIEHEILPKQIPVYYSLIFLLLVGMVGITFTNDLFNTYVFMEILAMTSCAIISINSFISVDF